MKLQDINGIKVLDAVDFTKEECVDNYDNDEYSNVCRFRLDGVVYVAKEDPEDGWRSSLGDLLIQEESNMTNVFPPVAVICQYSDKYTNEDDEYTCSQDILQIIDESTLEVILEVGTDYSDDGYPSFVSSFRPEAMITNKGDK